jgi:hypothetical protein
MDNSCLNSHNYGLADEISDLRTQISEQIELLEVFLLHFSVELLNRNR